MNRQVNAVWPWESTFAAVSADLPYMTGDLGQWLSSLSRSGGGVGMNKFRSLSAHFQHADSMVPGLRRGLNESIGYTDL